MLFKTFEDMLVEHETILVQFQAAWCPISKKLKSEWEKAATMLKENDNKARLATIMAPVYTVRAVVLPALYTCR